MVLPTHRRFWLPLCLAQAPAFAAAHGADANQIQLVVHEDVAELVATAPVEFGGLKFADDDHDGLLSRREMDAHRDGVRDALTAAVGVRDELGRPARLDRADVSLPQGLPQAAAGRDFVRLTLRLVFDAPPKAVTVRCGFAGDHPVTLLATRAESSSKPGVLTLIGASESTWFDADRREGTVLGGEAPVPTEAERRGSGPGRMSWMALAALGLLGLGVVVLLAGMSRRPAVAAMWRWLGLAVAVWASQGPEHRNPPGERIGRDGVAEAGPPEPLVVVTNWPSPCGRLRWPPSSFAMRARGRRSARANQCRAVSRRHGIRRKSPDRWPEGDAT